MATCKRKLTVRVTEQTYDKISLMAMQEYRSVPKHVDFILRRHIEDIERETGEIKPLGSTTK